MFHMWLMLSKLHNQFTIKNNTMTPNTRTTHTPQKQSYRLWWGAPGQCTISYDTYIPIMIQRIATNTAEIYIWNQAGKNNSITLSNIPSWPHQLWYVDVSEKVHFNCLDNKLNIWTRSKVVRGKHIIQPKVSAPILWPASNGMERMSQRHGSN